MKIISSSQFSQAGFLDGFIEFFSSEALMTPQLKAMGDLKVEVLSEQDGYAMNELETQALATNGKARLREVYLRVDGDPLLYGRTVIPEATLQAIGGLETLSTTPLGALLKQHEAKRLPLTFAQIHQNDVLFQSALKNLDEQQLDSLVARWSVFSLTSADHRLLVYEVALPAVHHRFESSSLRLS